MEVRYRLNQQGPVERILADWLRTDTYEGTHYFRARLPVLAPDTFVEYSAVCFCAGRQVPAPDQAEHLPGSCRISDVETVEAIDHTNATAASNCDPAGLLVPIDVSALCVGTVDTQQSTNGFAGATNVYTHQTTDDSPASIGANVNRSFSDPPWQQLEQGIHLHWALPDALTQGKVDEDGQLSFPAAPNRWLVTRFIIRGRESPQIKSWVVESDALSVETPEQGSGQYPVTLPVKTVSSDDPDFRYVGRWQAVEGWMESTPPPDESFRALTGSELTPVVSGVVSFAAFYPNCRSVFGFYDQLADVTEPGPMSMNLMYTVVGWFRQAENDPLHHGSSLPELQDMYHWTFEQSSAQPIYILYHGTIQDIVWNPDTHYIYGQPSCQPIPATVAIGNNPAEALSAYFKDQLHPHVPFFETLLTAFQLGLLNTFKQPQADQLAQLEAALHQHEFGGRTAGIFIPLSSNTPLTKAHNRSRVCRCHWRTH
ncbi:hypothetical protein C2W62_23250 [Candidatus Entotheonella serta]|nr:hypothetical protein C2W62_23250 [Candidatus Entotheonella serta]